MMLPVLIISTDPGHRDTLASITSSCGLRPVGCGTLSIAKYLLGHHQFTAIVYEVPESEDIGAAIKQVAGSERRTPIIVVSRIENWDSYLGAIAAGAFDYVEFPPYPDELERILWLALGESKPAEHAVAHA